MDRVYVLLALLVSIGVMLLDECSECSPDGEPTEAPGTTCVPGQPEICDGLDNDCDAVPDDGFGAILQYPDKDGDGYAPDCSIEVAISFCVVMEGYATKCDDCRDSDPSVYPGATEVCDDHDQDCDGDADEGMPEVTVCLDRDGDGYGQADEGRRSLEGQCGVLVNDEGTWYPCTPNKDGDCDGDPHDYNEDCDDTNPDIYPGAGGCGTGNPQGC